MCPISKTLAITTVATVSIANTLHIPLNCLTQRLGGEVLLLEINDILSRLRQHQERQEKLEIAADEEQTILAGEYKG